MKVELSFGRPKGAMSTGKWCLLGSDRRTYAGCYKNTLREGGDAQTPRRVAREAARRPWSNCLKMSRFFSVGRAHDVQRLLQAQAVVLGPRRQQLLQAVVKLRVPDQMLQKYIEGRVLLRGTMAAAAALLNRR